MSILDEIVANKKLEIVESKSKVSLKSLQEKIEASGYKANNIQKQESFQLIAEIKAKSPSVGIIREKFDPLNLVKEFESKNASAVSILTDQKYFGGSLEILQQIRLRTQLPILRKDFIVDPYQVWETRASAADLILFIVKILDLEVLESLLKLALELNLQPLVEVNNLRELEVIKKILTKLNCESKTILAVNNRDLNTFETTLETSLNLIKYFPEQVLKFSLSGIKEIQDLELLQKAGFDGVLIGESLAKNLDLFVYFS